MREISNRCFLLGVLSAKCAMIGADNNAHRPCAVSMAVVTLCVWDEGSPRRDSIISFRIGTRNPYKSCSNTTGQLISIAATRWYLSHL